MSKVIAILVAALIPLASIAGGAGSDDCLYNPQAFKEMLEELVRNYAKARLSDDQRAVLIPLEDGTAKVSYGGCEHYGTEIKFVAASNRAYTRTEAFAKATDLVRQFGQDRVDSNALGRLLSQRKYEEGPPGIFLVPYRGMDMLTIGVRREAGHSTITVSFYN